MTDHAVPQIDGGIADDVAGDDDLLEILVVHEGVDITLGEQELHLVLVQTGALDRFLGAEPLDHLVAGADVLHLELNERAALAGLHDSGLEDHHQLAIVLQDVTRTHLVGVDLHGM